MNGLQIIKTLALKIRYASIVEWYNWRNYPPPAV